MIPAKIVALGILRRIGGGWWNQAMKTAPEQSEVEEICQAWITFCPKNIKRDKESLCAYNLP